MKFLRVAIVTLLALGTAPAFGQDRPADTLQILREKIRADKKLLVAANMDLTESEAARFWPIYEEYQRDLQKSNERIQALIVSYARDYRDDSLTDEKAGKLIDEKIAIDEAEAAMQKAYVPKLSSALPAKKVARYMQIESKIRAAARWDLADKIPLVE
jgi:hypothetical protein